MEIYSTKLVSFGVLTAYEALNKMKLVFQTIRKLRDNNKIDDFDNPINRLNNINVH